MSPIEKFSMPVSSDLRTRYVPGVRIRQGLLSMAPWLDLTMIVLYLVMLQTRIVLQPGTVIELPPGIAASGLYTSLIAVVVVTGTRQDPVAKVFFDNEQYLLNNPKRIDALRDALASKRLERGEVALTLYADRRIENRYLTLLMQMAQESGIQRINLGTQLGAGRP